MLTIMGHSIPTLYIFIIIAAIALIIILIFIGPELLGAFEGYEDYKTGREIVLGNNKHNSHLGPRDQLIQKGRSTALNYAKKQVNNPKNQAKVRNLSANLTNKGINDIQKRANNDNSHLHIAKNQINNPKNQQKIRSFSSKLTNRGLNFTQQRVNTMQAPSYSKEELKDMGQPQLRNIAKQMHLNAGGSNEDLINRINRKIESGITDENFDPGPLKNENGSFKPGKSNIKLEKLTATYKPLNAPVFDLNQSKTHKAILTASGDKGEFKEQIIAKLPFQVNPKTVKIQELGDGSIAVSGQNLGGKNFDIIGTARNDIESPHRFPFLHRMHAPEITFRNLGNHKGSVLKVDEKNTEVLAKMPQQIKNVNARDIDNRMIIDGKNTGNRRFTFSIRHKEKK